MLFMQISDYSLVGSQDTAEVAEPDANVADADADGVVGGSAPCRDGYEGVHLNDLLRLALEHGASDLHLSAGCVPRLRINGALRDTQGFDVLDGDDICELVYAVLPQRQRETFEADWELDASYTLPGAARFRVNVFRQQGVASAVLRAIPAEVVPLDRLGLPNVVASFARLPRGLVLVTGPTGSGKSTTLASLIDIVNTERAGHIVTVEDPVEFVHTHKRSLVSQREVASDTRSFGVALRQALRQDPDVILVGELRDLDTIATALAAAETGHLVFATLHTQDAAQSIDRIIDVFEPHQQQQVRMQLSTTLQAVLTQQLVVATDRRRRLVAAEVLVATAAVRNLIREGKIFQIQSVMQAGRGDGMLTMEQSLADLVGAGQISYDTARSVASNPKDLATLCGR